MVMVWYLQLFFKDTFFLTSTLLGFTSPFFVLFFMDFFWEVKTFHTRFLRLLILLPVVFLRNSPLISHSWTITFVCWPYHALPKAQPSKSAWVLVQKCRPSTVVLYIEDSGVISIALWVIFLWYHDLIVVFFNYNLMLCYWDQFDLWTIPSGRDPTHVKCFRLWSLPNSLTRARALFLPREFKTRPYVIASHRLHIAQWSYFELFGIWYSFYWVEMSCHIVLQRSGCRVIRVLS